MKLTIRVSSAIVLGLVLEIAQISCAFQNPLSSSFRSQDISSQHDLSVSAFGRDCQDAVLTKEETQGTRFPEMKLDFF